MRKIMASATAAFVLGLAGEAAAQSPAPADPPFGVWSAQSGVVSVGPAAWAAGGWGSLLGRGPVGCYFTRVRAQNRWLTAQVCDWY
jgi:hypothetical protein